jgi:hypothetical protein
MGRVVNDLFWTLILANLVSTIISAVVFWSVPIILALVFKKKVKKILSKINKLLK